MDRADVYFQEETIPLVPRKILVSSALTVAGALSLNQYSVTTSATMKESLIAPSGSLSLVGQNATTEILVITIFPMINPDLGEYAHAYQTTLDLGQYSHTIRGIGTLGELDLGEYTRVLQQPGTLGSVDLKEVL